MIKPKSLTSLSIVFPCYNESENVAQMIEQSIKVGEDYGIDYEVIVVDDGSRDNSAEVIKRYAAKNSHVKLVSHEKNQGYGAAVATGLKSASKDLVFFTDGDNQFHVGDIEKLFSKIDGCDVVVGFRVGRKDKAYRRLNGSVWTMTAKFLFGLSIRDIDCAFKLFRRKCLDGLEFRSKHLLIHAEVMAKLKKKGCRVQEIGVTHYPRQAGKATATKPSELIKSVAELIRLYWGIR